MTLPRLSLVLAFCGLAVLSLRAQDAIAKLPLPADFPALDPNERMLGNGSPGDSSFTKLSSANRDLLRRLSDYTPDSVAAVFSNRMNQATNISMKLLLAAYAAHSGSESARDFIVATAASTDGDITHSRLSALRYLLNTPPTPPWVFDAVLQALSDTREVTSSKRSAQPLGMGFDVSYIADEMECLTYDLGTMKYRPAVPVLMEMARRTHGDRGPVTALGLIGDPRAIPLCLDLLHREEQAIKDGTMKSHSPSEDLLAALGGLKARDAVPTLLEYLFSTHAIAALGAIGDERAIGPLRQIVADHGAVQPDPYDGEERFQERTFAASMALINLEGGDPIPQWIALMQDQTLEWDQRCDALSALEDHPDPRAISPLLAAIKNDPHGIIVSRAITALSLFPGKTTVAGLIECFDIDFPAGPLIKRTPGPAPFRAELAATLHALTGQDFGPDKAQWTKWWTEKGVHDDRFK